MLPKDIALLATMRIKILPLTIFVNGLPFFMPVTHIKAIAADLWVPVGFNKNRVESAWVKPSSYKALNSDSFRVLAKYNHEKNSRQLTGKFDVNCKNKDYYFRPDGIGATGKNWSALGKGSPAYSAALLLCKRTSSAASWGYTQETKELWDGPLPPFSADMAEGEWIKLPGTKNGAAFYNDAVIKDFDNDTLTFSMYFRTEKGDMRSENQDVSRYLWLRATCKSNIASEFIKTDESGDGVWLPPTPGAPDGVTMAVRKQFCR